MMRRKCVWTGEGSKYQIEEVYKLFEAGWILDPWLHGTNRPWTTPTEVVIPVPGKDQLSSQTMHVWNLILLEEGDDPTDPEWVLKNCPVRNIPIPKSAIEVSLDPIVDEALISYDEVAGFAARGYELPEDKRWAKNRLAVLRRSVVTDMADRQGMAPLIREILEHIPSLELWDYIKARVEHEEMQRAEQTQLEAEGTEAERAAYEAREKESREPENQ